ncbi:MAG: hypothetical protein MUF77_08305 [Leptospira sp.]|nr:hypothetical protein [Leptospira sp.]
MTRNILFFLLLMSSSTEIFADTILLKSGKRITNVKTYLEGNQVQVIHPEGNKESIAKSEIDSIEPGPVRFPKKEKLSKEEELPPRETTNLENERPAPQVQTPPPLTWATSSPYYSFLPFYSHSLSRGELVEGVGFISGKMFFLVLYLRYAQDPKENRDLRENLLLWNTVNRQANENITPIGGLVRLNIFSELQEDTIDPFTGNTIRKEQYENRRQLSLSFFLLLTFWDVYRNFSSPAEKNWDKTSLRWSTTLKQDAFTKDQEFGVKFDFPLCVN